MRYLLIIICVSFAVTSCGSDDEEIVTPDIDVKKLTAPANESSITLGTSTSLAFEWEHSYDARNGSVYYQLLFDKSGGDFSNPIYTQVSDDEGLEKKATLDSTMLATVFNRAGGRVTITDNSIEGDDVQVIWIVSATTGEETLLASAGSNTLSIEIESAQKTNESLNRLIRVSVLETPEDTPVIFMEDYVNLDFNWRKSYDNPSVTYELLIDETDGDFSEPVYTSQSSAESAVSLDYSKLSEIYSEAHGNSNAGLVGLKWGIRSTLTTENVTVLSSVTRSFTLILEPGEENITDQSLWGLYIKGEGTEEPEAGRKFTTRAYFNLREKTFPGEDVYEIYTKITANGRYYFEFVQQTGSTFYAIDAPGGESYTGFGIDGRDNNKIFKDYAREKTNGATVPETAIYRIQVAKDFSSVHITRITDMHFFLPGGAKRVYLDYMGNGIWYYDKVPLTYAKLNSDNINCDYRYRFNFYIPTNGDGTLTDGNIRHLGGNGDVLDNVVPAFNQGDGYRDIEDLTTVGGDAGPLFHMPDELFDIDYPGRYTVELTLYLNQGDGYYHEFGQIYDTMY